MVRRRRYPARHDRRQRLTGENGEQQGFYQPTTFRFAGVQDGDRLPIDVPGLLVFYGQPAHFLDISILVSRDRSDSKDLGELISGQLNSDTWKSAAGRSSVSR